MDKKQEQDTMTPENPDVDDLIYDFYNSKERSEK